MSICRIVYYEQISRVFLTFIMFSLNKKLLDETKQKLEKYYIVSRFN